jgi:hypothetical protein
VSGRLSAVSTLALVALLVLSVTGCAAGPSPVTTVEDALEAMGALDIERMASFFTPDTRDYVTSGMDYYLSRLDDIDVSALRTRVVSEDGGTAAVEAEYDLTTVSSSGTRRNHVVKTVKLVEMGGDWLIADLSLIE